MINKLLFFSRPLHSSLFPLLCRSLCPPAGDLLVLLSSDAAWFFRALSTRQWWEERAVKKTVGSSRECGGKTGESVAVNPVGLVLENGV